MGRPKKYTPEEFEKKCKGFQDFCAEKKKIPTKGGLALYLDMNRDMLSDYETWEEYRYAIKEIYTVIEEEWVQRLGGNNVAGTIFYLKNAFKDRWRDKQEIENTGEITLTQKLLNADKKTNN